MADERDPKLSRRYRELGSEEPSRALDQTILAAARRAADRPHAPLVTPAGRHRWYFSLAAAAVLVLAVAVTLHIERQQPETDLMSVAPPAAAPAPPPTRPETAQRSRAVEQPQPRSEEAKDQSSGSLAERKAPAPAASSGGIAAPRQPTTMMSRADRAVTTPERELERIAELRRLGRDEDADRALAEFRKRYPDYRSPDAMRAKVEKK